MEQRLQQLELKIMDLELGLEQLNEVVTRQDLSLARMERAVAELGRRLQLLTDATDASPGRDPE